MSKLVRPVFTCRISIEKARLAAAKRCQNTSKVCVGGDSMWEAIFMIQRQRRSRKPTFKASARAPEPASPILLFPRSKVSRVLFVCQITKQKGMVTGC